jgi:hypothetical protein
MLRVIIMEDYLPMRQYPGVDNVIRSLIPASKTSYLNLLDGPYL